jgi:HD-GYP domain-containing protein (c-di-GMP phosphodiesterase class II)
MSSINGNLQPTEHPARDDGATDPIPILKAVSGLRQVTALYPHGHTIVQQSAAMLHELLLKPLERHPNLRLDVIEGDAHVDGEPYRLESQANGQVIRDFIEIGIDSIHVTRGVEQQELQATAEVLVAFQERSLEEPVNTVLAKCGVRHVNVGRLVALDTRWRAYDWPEAPSKVLDPDYAESLRLTQEAFKTLGERRGTASGAVREILQLLISKVARSNAALGQVLAIKEYENHTYCHSVNVAILSLLLGKQSGITDAMLEALVEGALLHDAGKMRIPVEILKKPGALDKREWEVIKRHPSLGAAMLLEISTLSPFCPTIALEHHRHWRGGGYPNLGDQEPHLLSQMVAVADIYEALTGARAYRAPALPEQACLVLARLAGQQLNPFLVKAFVNVVTFFPVGTLVRTSQSERGVVIRTTPGDPLHPVIALLAEDGSPSAVEVDTSQRNADGDYDRHIVETLRPHSLTAA